MGFKVGDRVRCKPGFKGDGKTSQLWRNPVYGGAAYEEGKILTIRGISKYPHCRDVVFFEECEHGVFIDALEYATDPAKHLTPFKFV